MIPQATMTSATAAVYLARAQNLLAAATRANGDQPPSPIEIVDWFLSSHDQWAPSTIRQYRSALRYFFGVLIHQKSERAANIQPALDRLEEVVVAPSHELSHGERARPRPSAKKDRLTSATKRRTLTLPQGQALDRAFAGLRYRYAALARGMTRLSGEFGLRPIEWRHAWLEGTTLVVPNAKCTNSRGNGPIRTLNLSAYTPAVVAEVQALMDAIDAALTAVGASWAKIYAGIQRAVRAASIQTGIVALRIKPACPYASWNAMRRISCTDQRINGRVVLSEPVFLGAVRWRDGGSPPAQRSHAPLHFPERGGPQLQRRIDRGPGRP